MTACADNIHARPFLKLMAGQKASPYIIGPAYVALAAAGVTGAAMFFSILADLLKNSFVLFIGPGFNSLSNGGQGVVQAVPGCGRDIHVALPANLIGIRKCRVPNDPVVGGLPVRVFGVTVVTRLACYFSVKRPHKTRVDIDLFVRLQRSQRSCSAFTGRLCGFARPWPDFFDLPTQADQFFYVSMACDTFTFDFSLRIPAGSTKEGHNSKDNYQARSIAFLFQQALHGFKL